MDVLVRLGRRNRIDAGRGLKQQRSHFSRFWRLEAQDPVVWFPLRLPSLPSCGRLLAGSSHGLFLCGRHCLPPNSLFLQGTGQVGTGPTLTASFSVTHLFKGLLSKYGHILRYWRLGLQHTNLGATIQPITMGHGSTS